LSDKSKQDITYKLSLRVAAMMAASGAPETPQDLFRLTRKVYDYRSAVVHGDDADGRRMIRDGRGNEAAAIEVAERLLRSCLSKLLNRPRTPREIDEEFVIQAMQSLRPGAESAPD